VRARLHQAAAHSDFGAFDHSCSPDPNTEEITIMEIVVRTTDFARVLRLVQTLADRKNTMPMLGTLLIRADAKGLTITGTDTDLGGISYCPAAIQAPGSAAIPTRQARLHFLVGSGGDNSFASKSGQEVDEASHGSKLRYESKGVRCLKPFASGAKGQRFESSRAYQSSRLKTKHLRLSMVGCWSLLHLRHCRAKHQ
jgi:hypothetical protein